MDRSFQSYSQVNGVPQESKLATYMKRQVEAPPLASITHTLSKNVSKLNFMDTPPAIHKKVSVPSGEFVPRIGGSPSLVSYSTPASPRAASVTPPVSNVSPTPTAINIDTNNLPTYQENVGGTTYFYPAAGGGEAIEESEEPSGGMERPASMYPGTPPHVATARVLLANGPAHDAASFYAAGDMRLELHHKHSAVLLRPDPTQYPDLPSEVDNYHELCPLEPIHKTQLISYQTSTYKAANIKTGLHYCLRRIHGFRLASTKCMLLVDMWKKMNHSNIVQLREVFTTKAFGDQSMVFVYDYYPDSETLLTRHFSQGEALNGYTDTFSSNPNAPRPYSHHKNSLLRQQHSSGRLPENTLWSYVIQLTSALRVIHAAGLACRSLDPSKVLATGRLRLRLSCTAIPDVLMFDASAANPLSVMALYQQEDLIALGKLLVALACRSLMAVQRENLQTSLDLMARTYSPDLRHLIMYLLSGQPRRSVIDLMPMIGARFYTQLDAVQLHCDVLDNEMAKEMENGRLCRLLVKLGTINERPELSLDPTWAETGDRYMLKLFRDYLFHQVTEDGRPWLDMSHVVHCLNKLDVGTQEKVCLMSRDQQSILVVTYAELKHCLEQSFQELTSAASPSKPDVTT